MTVTWTLEFIPQDVAGKSAYIRGTRVDDAPDPDDVRTYVVSGHVATQQEIENLLDAMYQKYVDEIANETAVSAVVAPALISQMETYMNNKEA